MRLVGLGVLGVGFREFWVSEPGLGFLGSIVSRSLGIIIISSSTSITDTVITVRWNRIRMSDETSSSADDSSHHQTDWKPGLIDSSSSSLDYECHPGPSHYGLMMRGFDLACGRPT